MSLQLGATQIAQVKLGTSNITSIRQGTTLVWSATGIRDDADRQDSIGLGSNWTDLGPAVTPNLVSVYSRYFRMNMEDDASVQAAQTDRQVYNAATSPANDGYLETVPLTEGDPALQTILWRRANTTLTNAVGIKLVTGTACVVSRISSTEVERTSKLDFQPGEILRLTQTGNVHVLTVAGNSRPPVTWNDSGGLASSGASFRSMGLTMQGSRILLHGRSGATTTDEYVRQYSPALEYVEMS